MTIVYMAALRYIKCCDRLCCGGTSLRVGTGHVSRASRMFCTSHSPMCLLRLARSLTRARAVPPLKVYGAFDLNGDGTVDAHEVAGIAHPASVAALRRLGVSLAEDEEPSQV